MFCQRVLFGLLVGPPGGRVPHWQNSYPTNGVASPTRLKCLSAVPPSREQPNPSTKPCGVHASYFCHPLLIATQELAELGGGGHETICASVQEHIADTYLGYGGTHVALPGPGGGSSNGHGNTENSRSRPGRGKEEGVNASQADGPVDPAVGSGQSRRVPWTVDSEGEVWTSPAPLRQPPVSGKAKGAPNKKGKNRGKTRAGRKTTTPGDDFDGGRKGGGSHPGSVRLGGGGSADGDGDGDGVPFPAGAGAYTNMDKNAERQREENLDKAQVWLAGSSSQVCCEVASLWIAMLTEEV